MLELVSLLGAVTPLGQAFIGIVPDLIRVVSERNKSSTQEPNLQLEQERLQIQQELQLLRQQLQQEQIKQRKQMMQVSVVEQRQMQEGQRELFRQQKQLELQLAIYNRETQLKIADYQRQATLQLPEVQKLFDNWPLTIVPSQILNSHHENNIIPLRIFLSPPKVLFERYSDVAKEAPEIEPKLAQGLSEFLDKYYSLQDRVRPTEFLGGAWDSKRARREASIKALYGMLKSEPSLILESEIINDSEISLRFGYWGIGQESYSYQSIVKLPYKEIMYDSAQARALKWKENRYLLLNRGKTPEELRQIGGDADINLEILEEEDKLKNVGIDTKDLAIHSSYRLNNQDFESFCQFLVTCHCLVAAWLVDAHYLIHYDVPPLLPKLLHELVNNVHHAQVLQPLLEGIIKGYQMLYFSLLDERPSWEPELYLQLAKSLSSLSDKSWAREQIYNSVKSWLKQHQESSVEGTEALEKMKSVITVADEKYIKEIQECFRNISDTSVNAQLLSLDWAIARQKRETKNYYQQSIELIKKEKYQEAIEKINQAIDINPICFEAYFSRAFIHNKLGNNVEAIKDYTQSIILNNKYIAAYVNRGNIYLKNGNYETAIADYDRALSLNPNLAEADQYRHLAIQSLESAKPHNN